jgi:hypothetical protein
LALLLQHARRGEKQKTAGTSSDCQRVHRRFRRLQVNRTAQKVRSQSRPVLKKANFQQNKQNKYRLQAHRSRKLCTHTSAKENKKKKLFSAKTFRLFLIFFAEAKLSADIFFATSFFGEKVRCYISVRIKKTYLNFTCTLQRL